MKLLFVENHCVFRDLVIGQFLGGHTVETAETLEDARRLLRQGSFDGLLVDYDLDDGKGDLLVRECRLEGYQGVVVAVSSHQEGNERLVSAGADAICPKAGFSAIDAVIQRAAAARREMANL